MEDKWYEFDLDNFPHYKIMITSPGFLHGGEEVFLFDGPQFDSAK